MLAHPAWTPFALWPGRAPITHACVLYTEQNVVRATCKTSVVYNVRSPLPSPRSRPRLGVRRSWGHINCGPTSGNMMMLTTFPDRARAAQADDRGEGRTRPRASIRPHLPTHTHSPTPTPSATRGSRGPPSLARETLGLRLKS